MTGTPASAGQRGGTPTSFGAEPAQTPWTCLHQLPGLRPPRREGATAGVGRCLLFGVGGRRLFCQLGSAFVLLAASFGFVPSSVGLGSSWRPSVHPDRPPAGCVWAAAVPICPLRAASHNKAFCWLLDAAPICLFALGSPGCMGPVTCVPPGTQGQKGKPDPMGLQMGWGGGGPPKQIRLLPKARLVCISSTKWRPYPEDYMAFGPWTQNPSGLCVPSGGRISLAQLGSGVHSLSNQL